MAEIQDTGKVWIRGTVRPAFAVKAEDTVFVLGQEEGQEMEYWLEEGALCVDLHHRDKAIRVARRFPLNLKATHPATLFSGFQQTKHADVAVVMPEDPGVWQYQIEGKDYHAVHADKKEARDFHQEILKDSG